MNRRVSYYVVPGIIKVGITFKNAMLKDLKNAIIREVCNIYSVTMEQLTKKDRHRNLVEARQVIYFLCDDYKVGTLKAIGEIFGMDHTTVIHSRQTVKDLIDTQPEFADRIKYLKLKISVHRNERVGRSE